MEIRKLKKRLLKEERRRRKQTSKAVRIFIVLILCTGAAAAVGLFFAAPLREAWVARQYAQAGEHIRSQNYEAAHKAFSDLADTNRESEQAPEAAFQAAEVLSLYLKRYQEAILAYLLVERDYPDSVQAAQSRLRVAEIYKNRVQDFSRAIVAYQKILDLGGDELDRIQYEVADCYFRLNNFEQARIEFESLVKSFPESGLVPEGLYRLGVSAALEGQSQVAEKAYRQLSEGWPENLYAVEARFSLAALLEEREELKTALRILEGLKGIYPNPEALQTKLEQVRQRIKRKKKAI